MKQVSQFLILLSASLAALSAAALPPNEPNPPVAEGGYTLNFMPIERGRGDPITKKNVFAACGVGDLPIGFGAKMEGGTGMCGNRPAGPGTYKESFVHDGYIPNEVLYLQEIEESKNIWHQVLVDEKHGFYMDIYIRMDMGTAGLGQGKSMSAGKNAGHVWVLEQEDSLRYIPGNGTGDPRRVNYRMLILDEGFAQDMVKTSWDRKPVITQNINDAGMNLDLLIDMSNSTFADMNTPAHVSHTLSVAGADENFSFDSYVDTDAHINGGRFRVYGGDEGVDPHYDYVDAPNDYGKNLDWLDYWAGSQYWQPGDPYGHGVDDGSSGDGEDGKW